MVSPQLKACFERAITLEQMVQKYYLRVAGNFFFEAGIRDVFMSLATDEEEHAKALAGAMEALSGNEAPQADWPSTLLRLNKLQARLADLLSNAYGDFAGAFKVAEEIENSEINTIFLLLASGKMMKPGEASPHKAMMDRHLQKVVKLGTLYPASARAKILPRYQ